MGSNIIRKLYWSAGAALTAAILILIFTLPAAAATFTPGTTAELILAIETANGNGEANIINLSSGATYTLTTFYGSSGLGSKTGLPAIAGELTINGNGATISRSQDDSTPNFRIMWVTETGSLTINAVTIANGGEDIADYQTSLPSPTSSLQPLRSAPTPSTKLPGAGILNEGTLVVNNCTLENNFSDEMGGAIANDETGTLTVNTSIINNNLAIVGGGISSTGTTTCTDTTISNNMSLFGCGLLNFAGTTIVNNCVVKNNLIPIEAIQNNQDYFPGGGGLVNVSIDSNHPGILEVNECTIKENLALYGCGISNGLVIDNNTFIPGGELTVRRSTISGNLGLFGAGFFNLAGNMTVGNSTISGNIADMENFPTPTVAPSFSNSRTGSNQFTTIGSGFMNLGMLQINDCTVTANQADIGGGITTFDPNSLPHNLSGSAPPPDIMTAIKNSIVAGNTAANGTDCLGEFQSLGFNLIGALPVSDPAEYTFVELDNPGTNQFGEDPLLGPLQDNGGPTFTHALEEDSPAVNAGDCTDIAGNPVGVDQRNELRPYLVDGICDIGAYEYPSLDGTGVPPAVQNAGPNDGDGNGDGTPDYRQRTVASLPAAGGGGYLTVEVSGCDQVSKVTTSAAPQDPDYLYPFGLVGFEINCPTATVRIYYHDAENLDGMIYRKHGPTPDDWNTPVWYDMPGVTFGTKEIDGKTVPYAEFTLTEGVLGDDTETPPIIDAGGPATAQAAIPTLNEWGLMLMSLLLAGISLFTINRRRERTEPGCQG